MNLDKVTFEKFQELNEMRSDEVFHKGGLDEWSSLEWSAAIAGEVGELCNLLKKCKRGDFTEEEKIKEIAEEIADIIIYCDLLASRLNISTAGCVVSKFNEVSKKRRSTIFITDMSISNE